VTGPFGNLKDLMNMEMKSMKMVGYLVNYPNGISGEKGIYYNYILAANGLFIEAANPMLAARIPVAGCEVKGLAPIKTKFALTYGSIPQYLFDLALDTFLAVPDREHYVAVTASAGYHLYVPVQDKGDASVVYEVGDCVVLDIHSHGHMRASFSSQDNADEVGLKLYAVVGRLHATPVVKLRVGVYGYFHSLAWRDVFDGCLVGAAEFEDEEVKIEGDLHGIAAPDVPELQHLGSWLRWDRFFRR
jgi:PRTRC genetic system protein A